MTSKNTDHSRNRDQQDQIERHVHGEVSYADDGAGMIIKVKGNGTEDEGVNVLRIGGVWLHLPKNTNADVFLLAGNSDTNQKHALTDVPRDKHKKTTAGTSGLQHPTNPDISITVSDKGVRVDGENFAVGKSGAFEVKDGKVFIRGDLEVSGTVKGGKVETPALEANTVKGTVAPGGSTIAPVVAPIEPVTPAPDLSDYQGS